MVLASVSFAQTLTPADKKYLQTVRSIKSIQKNIRAKKEERRIAISEVRTTFQLELDDLDTQIKTLAESVGLTVDDFER